MHKTLITGCLLIIAIFLCNFHNCANGQELILSSEKISRLDRKGEVFISKILDNGRIAYVSEQKGEDCSIIISDMRGSLLKKFRIPVKQIDYIVISDDGKQALVYSREDYEFLHVDLKRGKTRTIFRMEKGKTGFALFDKKVSWLDIYPGGIITRGYYYNDDGLFSSDNIVFIQPDKTGIAVFLPIVETDRLLEGAKHFYPSAKEITSLQICGDKIVFCGQDKNGGVILSYDIRHETLSKIDNYIAILGSCVSESGNWLVYIVRRQPGDNLPVDMILYNLQEKAPKRVWTGRFFSPKLSQAGEFLAVGFLIPVIGDRYLTRIKIYRTDKTEKEGEEHEILPAFKPIDWKFVRDSKDLFLFATEGIYRYRISK